LTELGCGYAYENVNFHVTAGQHIYLQVGNYMGDGGPLTVTLNTQ
ncbi:MAG: hypothetical protein QOG62_223, partial [Thermoleophilaceae bacterium]|nr:hypothetical protein [Thermoleophilaceae bacterium]MEA2623487.1 hypothetical protein [Chloroflexota bacterium]